MSIFIETLKMNTDVIANEFINACGKGDLYTVIEQIALGVHLENDNGFFGLCKACSVGNNNIAELLINYGFLSNKTDYKKWSILHYTCYGGNIETLNLILSRGCYDINMKDIYGATCLHIACQHGHLEIAKYLINLGANMHDEDDHNMTCLFYTCLSNNDAHVNVSIVNSLIEKGINIHKVNNDGETCLFFACINNAYDVARVLIDNGSNIGTINKHGTTAFHSACKHGYLDIVKLLIKNGANAKSLDAHGYSGIHYANIMGHYGVTKYLEEL